MLTEERHSLILNALEEKGTLTVLELVNMLNTSESTIRRDLATLDHNGRLRKVHGGAVKLDSGMILNEPNITEKEKLFTEEKEKISRYAAQTIKKNDFVYLDAGTTTEKMIEYITEKSATFVTNGFNHARLLAKRGFRVYLVGGEVKHTTEAIVGTSCIEMLKSYNFTKCFLGTNGISAERGYTTHNIDEASVKRVAVERGYVSFILADHSKFDRIAAVSFAEISKACIITDYVKNNKYSSYTVIKEVCR